MNYYTYNSTTRRLALAKDPAVVDGRMIVHPSAAQYAALGAYPLASPMPPAPTPPEGKVAVCDGYELRDGVWVALWAVEDAPDPLDDAPLRGVAVTRNPTQNELNDVVKEVVGRLGGTVES